MLVVSYTTFSPLPVPSGHRRSGFCGTFRRVTPPGRYPAPCPVESGLSSVGSATAAVWRTRRNGRLAASSTPARRAYPQTIDTLSLSSTEEGYPGNPMCGRYVINEDPDSLAAYFGVDRVVAEPLRHSYNVAPTDEVYGVAEHKEDRLLGVFRWGLIPHWARDRKGPLNINARAETIAAKPSFRDSLRRRRCIIPAGGFFEWSPKSRGRQPYYVTMADGSPMAFAGIWASWKDPETEAWTKSCSIITTRANESIASIHTRMPVILQPDQWNLWLDREIRQPEAVQPLLIPLPSDRIAYHPVTTKVNSVRNNHPDNIAPLADSG